jgi:hypothetical protein
MTWAIEESWGGISVKAGLVSVVLRSAAALPEL